MTGSASARRLVARLRRPGSAGEGERGRVLVSGQPPPAPPPPPPPLPPPSSGD